jgi:hypothetical protein
MDAFFNNSINTRNIIDIIDNTVLELKSIKLGGTLKKSVKEQIVAVLNFLKDARGDNYKNLLDKAIFIEEKPLENLHFEMKLVNIEKDNIEGLIKVFEASKKLNEQQINDIQRKLIEVSIPIWNVSKKKD